MKRCSWEKYLLCSALCFGFGRLVCKEWPSWGRSKPCSPGGAQMFPSRQGYLGGMFFSMDSYDGGSGCLVLSVPREKAWFVNLYWWIIFSSTAEGGHLTNFINCWWWIAVTCRNYWTTLSNSPALQVSFSLYSVIFFTGCQNAWWFLKVICAAIFVLTVVNDKLFHMATWIEWFCLNSLFAHSFPIKFFQISLHCSLFKLHLLLLLDFVCVYETPLLAQAVDGDLLLLSQGGELYLKMQIIIHTLRT